MPNFAFTAGFAPAGGQPEAIKKLAEGVDRGQKHQVLMGVTGSGKTMVVAQMIQEIQRPTLVMSPNKTLAAQLCSEFRSFFPQNAVEYFVSYYDYYQPEAYIPRSDTYIEKDSSRNDVDFGRSCASSRTSNTSATTSISVGRAFGCVATRSTCSRLTIKLQLGSSSTATILSASSRSTR